MRNATPLDPACRISIGSRNRQLAAAAALAMLFAAACGALRNASHDDVEGRNQPTVTSVPADLPPAVHEEELEFLLGHFLIDKP